MRTRNRCAVALAVAVPFLHACASILGIDLPPLRDDGLVADAGPDGAGEDAAERCVDDLATSSLNCGRCGHSCLGDPCREGACIATPIATGQNVAYGVGVDGTTVFWTAREGRSLLALDKSSPGATPRVLLQKPDPFGPVDLVVDGDAITVVDSESGNGTASLFRIAKTGGPAAPIGGGCAPDGNHRLVFDDSHYFFANPAQGNIYRASKGSGECGAIVLGQPDPSSVLVDGTTLFFTSSLGAKNPSGLSKVPKTGGTPTPIAPGTISAASNLATDGAALFVTVADGRLLRVEKDGTGIVVLATGMVDATAIVADASGVYWAAAGDVWAGDVRLGAPRRLASVQTDVAAIATDDKRVYWTTRDTVMRVAK